jgi:hypothetical protein
MVNLLDLPQEILIHIFAIYYRDFQLEVIRSNDDCLCLRRCPLALALTCRSIRNTALDVARWELSPHLSAGNIAYCYKGDDACVSICGRVRSLIRSVSLRCDFAYPVLKYDMRRWMSLLSYFDNLETLEITHEERYGRRNTHNPRRSLYDVTCSEAMADFERIGRLEVFDGLAQLDETPFHYEYWKPSLHLPPIFRQCQIPQLERLSNLLAGRTSSRKLGAIAVHFELNILLVDKEETIVRSNWSCVNGQANEKSREMIQKGDRIVWSVMNGAPQDVERVAVTCL